MFLGLGYVLSSGHMMVRSGLLKVRAGVEMCRSCRKRIPSEKNVVNLAPMSPVLAG